MKLQVHTGRQAAGPLNTPTQQRFHLLTTHDIFRASDIGGLPVVGLIQSEFIQQNDLIYITMSGRQGQQQQPEEKHLLKTPI